MFRSLIFTAALLAIGPLTAPAWSQDDIRQQSIVVTASRIEPGDLLSTPNITQKVRADFIMVDMVFQTGSRDRAERRRELETMFNRAVAKAAAMPGFAVASGNAGEAIAPIETTLFDDIYRSSYGNTSSFTLVLTIDTRAGETFEKAMDRALAFMNSIELSGRAEPYLEDEQFIGARNPQKYREAILSDLSKDVETYRALFGTDSEIKLGGLENKVITQPIGPLELEIFIPYTLSVTTK